MLLYKIPILILISILILGCSQEFLNAVSKPCGTYAETDPRYSQCMQHYGFSQKTAVTEHRRPEVATNRPGKVISQSNNSELQKLASDITELLKDYGGGDVAQEGKFQGCTFYLKQGEENYKIWNYTIPLGVLHHQSLRNYRLRLDQHQAPAVLLKTANGKALIENTFLLWTFGRLEPPLKTQVTSVMVSFADEGIARAAANAFARTIEICAGIAK
jgi:hypothetical protein